MLSSAQKADLTLVLVVIIWGTTFVAVQRALDEIQVHSFHVLRFGIATLVLLPLLVLRKPAIHSGAPAPRGLLLKVGFLAGFCLWVSYSLQTTGLLHTTPSRSGFLTGMAVVIVPVLAFLLLRERMEKRAIIGVSMATAGLAFLAFGPGGTVERPPQLPDIPRGDLLTVGSAVAFAFQIIIKARWASQLSALKLTIVELTTVFLLSLSAALLLEDFPDPTKLSPTLWGAVLLTGLLATAFAFLAQTWAQRTTTAVRTAVVFAFEPVTAAIFAWLVIGEMLSPLAVFGGVLIVAGVLRTSLGSKKNHSD